MCILVVAFETHSPDVTNYWHEYATHIGLAVNLEAMSNV